MDGLTAKLPAIKSQHFILLIVCAVAVYLCRVREKYVLLPSWRQDFDTSQYQNGKFPFEEERLPPPIITDLEGDGSNELILITPGLKLQVFSLPYSTPDDVLPHVVIAAEISLKDSNPHLHPIRIETGYLEEYSETQSRAQVIVLAMDDWSVHCYAHNLTLLWTQVPMDIQDHKDYFVKSMAILITPVPISRGSQGSVIVGASFHHREHHKLKMERMEKNPGLGSGLDPARLHGEHRKARSLTGILKQDNFTHFSTCAMSGSDGSVQWHHLPGDFLKNKPKQLEHPHHWKLSLQKHHSHIGESQWEQYSNSILKQLPHSWSDLYDTTFDLQSVHANGYNEHQEQDSVMKEFLGLDHTHLVGLAYGGMKPHSHHEHIRSPNALVLHHDTGIEVLSFTSGQPITKLELHQTHSTYADINADATIEQIHTDFSDEYCEYLVSSLHPISQLLYTNPLCEAPNWWSLLSLNSNVKVREDTGLAIIPVLVNRVAIHSGPLSHLMGHTLPSQQKGYDSLFITSAGRMSSFGPHGHFNWQTVVASGWADTVMAYEDSDFDYSDLLYSGFKPSLTPYSTKLYGKQDRVLSIGWDHATVVDLTDGSILTEHTIPCPAIHAPVIGDFNGDGWTDFIHICPSGLIGFSAHSHPNYSSLVIISCSVILVILLLTWCCQASSEKSHY